MLSAIPPKPQLQFELSNAVTLYAGAEILAGTYALNDQFGSSHSGTTIGGEGGNLNDKILDFTEVRLGVGTTWKFRPNLSLDVSAGYVAYREFQIHDDKFGYAGTETTFHNNLSNGAPYVETGISGSF